MDEIILNGNPTRRVRLSREELLAGKCFPEDSDDYSLDPRLRSPDDILSQHVQRTLEPAPSPYQSPIAALQQRYEAEIKAWRDYELKVQEWKKEVMTILEQFKNLANEKESVVYELQIAQEKLKQQEQELIRMRQQTALFSSTPF